MSIGHAAISSFAISAAEASGGAAPATRARAPLRLTAQITGGVRAPLRLTAAHRAGRARAPLQLRAGASGRAAVALRLVALPAGIQLPGSAGWRLIARVGGVDVSSRLRGVATIEAVEGAARLADVAFRPAPGALDLPGLIGATVELDAQLGSAPPLRRFSGVVDTPEYDPATGTVTLRCTDNLQARIDALPAAALAALLAGARHSAIVFDDTRAGYERAQDLLSTLCASMDADAHGALRVTPWAVGAPARTLAAAHYIDGTLRTRFAEFTRLPPRVEIELQYKFPRLKIRGVEVAWQYGWSETFAAENGLRRLSAEVVAQALESTGCDVAALHFDRYPAGWNRPEGGSGQLAWVWYDPALCRGFRGLALRRYVQDVTERYRVVVLNPYAPAQAQPGPLRDTLSVSVAVDTSAWEREATTDPAAALDYLPAAEPALPWEVPPPAAAGETWLDITDRPEDGRAAFGGAAAVLVARAQRQIQSALRAGAVEFDVPLDPTVDVTQTLAFAAAGVAAAGKVRRWREAYDNDAGTAITTVELAISPAPPAPAGALTMPAPPDTVVTPAPAELSATCGNYLGSVAGAPAINAGMVGFFTNAAPSLRSGAVFDPAAEAYPEHFTVELPAVGDDSRAPRESAELAVTVSAGSPGGNMTLEVL